MTQFASENIIIITPSVCPSSHLLLTFPDAPQSESEAESIYESRKLLIRQIQGQIAKQVHEGRDSVSEYDSWSERGSNVWAEISLEHAMEEPGAECARIVIFQKTNKILEL